MWPLHTEYELRGMKLADHRIDFIAVVRRHIRNQLLNDIFTSHLFKTIHGMNYLQSERSVPLLFVTSRSAKPSR